MSRIAMTVGVFDLFHKGHRNLFRYMARLGDEIVVGIHDWQSTYINKGIILTDPLRVRRSHVLKQSKVKKVFTVNEPNPGEALKKVVKDYKEKGHELVYVRGNDWSDFPGKDVLEEENIPIILKEYTKDISSTELRRKLDEIVQAIYNALTDTKIPDEDIIPLLEEGVFMPSDAVMRKVYNRLYDDGQQHVFGERFTRLSKLIGNLWTRPESKKLIPRFIKRMYVNTDELDKDISEFSSLNEFFARKIDLKKRPFEKGGPSKRTIYSPSDGLVLLYSNLQQAYECFIKSEKFSLEEFLNHEKSLISMVNGGPMAIIRLQPKDIHRMYAPLSGKLGEFHWAGKRLHTVKSEIVTRPDVAVFTENIRLTIPFQNSIFGSFLMTAIGAPLIGSIVTRFKPGDNITVGQELGYFQYGGSTVVLLFPPKPKINWSYPLNRKYEDEAPVRIHQRLGRIKDA